MRSRIISSLKNYSSWACLAFWYMSAGNVASYYCMSFSREARTSVIIREISVVFFNTTVLWSTCQAFDFGTTFKTNFHKFRAEETCSIMSRIYYSGSRDLRSTFSIWSAYFSKKSCPLFKAFQSITQSLYKVTNKETFLSAFSSL